MYAIKTSKNGDSLLPSHIGSCSSMDAGAPSKAGRWWLPDDDTVCGAINSMLQRFQFVKKSVKHVLGYKQILKLTRQGKVKRVTLANNAQLFEEIWSILHHVGQNWCPSLQWQLYWAQYEENTSVCTLAVTQIQVIWVLLKTCQNRLPKSKPQQFFFKKNLPEFVKKKKSKQKGKWILLMVLPKYDKIPNTLLLTAQRTF